MSFTTLLLRIEQLEPGKFFATLRHPNEGISERVEFAWLESDTFDGSTTYLTALKNVNEFSATTPKNPYLERLGSALYALVFQGNLKLRFETWCRPSDDITLRIYCADAALAGLPWEVIRDPAGYVGQRILILRYDERWGNRKANLAKPLTALVVTASPQLPHLAFNDEIYADQVSAHLRSGGVEVMVERNVTRLRLISLLDQHRPRIFHFVGHGSMEATGGSILLIDPDYKTSSMEGGLLGQQLTKAGVQFAFLCSCETGKDSNAFRGVAAAIVEKGVPSVIAMQFNLPQDDSRIFVERFYGFLSKGSSVETSLAQTRASYDGKRLVWFIPALHSQVEGEVTLQQVEVPKRPVDIEKNPFLDIGAQSDPARYAGQHAVINDLVDALLQRRNVLISGERRIGKTALLRMITDGGKCRKFGLDTNLHFHIFNDVSETASQKAETTEAALWQNAIRRLERAIDETFPESPRSPELDKIMSATKAVRASGGDRSAVWKALQLASRQFSIAFFLDEFDHLIEKGLPRDFFDWLVLVNEQLSVQFIAAPRLRPEHYVEQGNGMAQQFFQSCRAFNLCPLTPPDLTEYLELHFAGSVPDHFVRFGAALQYVSGRTPFYLQIACAELFQVRAFGMEAAKAWVSRFWTQASKFLPDHWYGSTMEEQTVLATLALRSQGPGRGARLSKQALSDYWPRTSAFDSLRDRGLAYEQDGRVALTNAAFEAWILGHLTARSSDSTGGDTDGFSHWFQQRYTQHMADVLPARAERLFNRLNPELWPWVTKWCRRLRYQESVVSLLSLAPMDYDPVKYLAERCPAVEYKR